MFGPTSLLVLLAFACPSLIAGAAFAEPAPLADRDNSEWTQEVATRKKRRAANDEEFDGAHSNGPELIFTDLRAFFQIPSKPTLIQLRASLLFFSDTGSVSLGGGGALGVSIAHMVAESSKSRTRLVVGITASLAAAGDSNIGPADEPDVLTHNIRHTMQAKSLELGIAHTVAAGRSSPLFLEGSWTPGLITRGTYETREFFSSVGGGTEQMNVDESITALLQFRLAMGWQRRSLRYWGEVSVLAEGDGNNSFWFGMGADLGI